MCLCKKIEALEKENEIKDRLIKVLTEALNEPCYCEKHIIFRKCENKTLMCGDCLVKDFYEKMENV